MKSFIFYIIGVGIIISQLEWSLVPYALALFTVAFGSIFLLSIDAEKIAKNNSVNKKK